MAEGSASTPLPAISPARKMAAVITPSPPCKQLSGNIFTYKSFAKKGHKTSTDFFTILGSI